MPNAPSNPRKARNGKREVRVRMYRQGLGDCFLVTISRTRGSPFHLMIDCGVILGTEDASEKMQKVVKNIIAVTGGKVDVLAVTHEHWDHLSGFVDAGHLFAPKSEHGERKSPRPARQLEVGQVWMAWTEDPADASAAALRRERNERVERLTGFVERMRMRFKGSLQSEPTEEQERTVRMQGIQLRRDREAYTSMERIPAKACAHNFGLAAQVMGVGEILSYFGVGLDGTKPKRSTRDALEFAKRLSNEPLRYCRPSAGPWTQKDLPGVRIFVLGPPQDERRLRKTGSATELYKLDGVGAPVSFFVGGPSVSLGEPRTQEQADEQKKAQDQKDWQQPFDAVFRRGLKALEKTSTETGDGAPDTVSDFFRRHYFGAAVDSIEPEQDWRRIEDDWLGAAAEFALQLDNATNNTSLVLAIELTELDKVLLFVADAQVGNWLSWHELSWTIRDEAGRRERVTGLDLLTKTIFYKVGHHGSHNATLRAKGLELMRSNEFVAFIPVNEAMAKKKGWGQMPLPGLVAALEKRGRVVRADEDYLDDAKSSANRDGSGGRFVPGELFHEWILTI